MDIRLKTAKLSKLQKKTAVIYRFFLKAVTALVKGRGEDVTALETDLTDYFIVLTCPDFKVSTKEAYSLFDNQKDMKYMSLQISTKETAELLKKRPDQWGFFNSFTPVLKEKEPVLKKYSEL